MRGEFRAMIFAREGIQRRSRNVKANDRYPIVVKITIESYLRSSEEYSEIRERYRRFAAGALYLADKSIVPARSLFPRDRFYPLFAAVDPRRRRQIAE